MKRSVLAVMAVSFFAVVACQPAEEQPAQDDMPMMEDAPQGEQQQQQQPPAAPMDTGMADTMDGGMPNM